MYLQKVNNSKVGDIPMSGGKRDTRPIKGAEIIEELYPNIFLLGKKKSGKTTTIFHILKNKIGPKTHVTIISSSLYNDQGWKDIRSYLDAKGIDYDAHVKVVEKEGKEKRSVLSELVDRLKEEAKDREDQENDKKQSGGQRSSQDIYLDAMLGKGDDKKKKEKKEKYQYPKEIIILDDLGKHMRDPSVANLLIQNRHYKSLVMLSGQYIKYLEPDSRENINLWLIFKGQPDKLLKEIHEDSHIDFSFPQFSKMYRDALKYKRSFFYVNPTDDDFRVTFTHKFKI